MGNIGKRIRPLRESLELGRAEFARKIGVKKQLIISVEHSKQRPTEELLEGIAREWPRFAYWLLTGRARIEYNDIDPRIEISRRMSIIQ